MTQKNTSKKIVDTTKVQKRKVKQNLIQSPKGNLEKPATIQFLLTEYNELNELWKHTDSRIESVINVYITVCAFVFPGLGLLYQAISSIQIFILASVPVALAMFIFSFFLVQRITSADFNKSEYKLGMQIIRRYFVENDEGLVPYLYMPVALSVKTHQAIKSQRSPHFHKNIALVVYSFNGFLAGLTAGSFLWLVLGSLLMPAYIILLSIGFSLTVFIALIWHYQRKVKRLLERMPPNAEDN